MSTTMIAIAPDPCVCFPATWEIYTALVALRGDGSRPKYIYVDGRITVVSPSHNHEAVKKRIGWMIEHLLTRMIIDFHPAGSTTLLKSQRPRAGTEADESYYLTNIDRVVGKKDLFMGVDPPPDLVVEVVVSHSAADALEVYRRIGVREVWVYHDGGLEFLVLGADGTYHASPTSALLPPLAAADLAPWVDRLDPKGERQIRRDFRAWVAATLPPGQRDDDEI